MAKKNDYRFSYDSPVVISFVLLGVIALAVDSLALNGKLQELAFTCHAFRKGGFDFKNGFEYLRLFSHIFGSTSWELLLLNSAFLLLLGPSLEEKYGSLLLSLMIVITAFVSGLLMAATGFCTFTGSSCIVFMMILLASLTAFSKKTVEFSWILTFLLYTGYKMVSQAGTGTGTNAAAKSFADFLILNIPTFIDLAAGIIGSLLAFLLTPKKRGAAKKTPAKASKKKAASPASQKTVSYGDDYTSYNDYSETHYGSEPTVSSSDDETIVGTLN